VRDRGQGFQNAADEAGNFEFVATQSADWSRSKAQELVQNLIQAKGKNGFDAIYAQNDEMALGAALALQQAGLVVNKDIFLVGVDGMKEAFDAIKSDKLSASVTCTPKFAAQIFDTIEAGIAGKPIPGSLAVHDKLVDRSNVDAVYDLGF
jgi:ABC-type sugar transport system substrate-binding protein